MKAFNRGRYSVTDIIMFSIVFLGVGAVVGISFSDKSEIQNLFSSLGSLATIVAALIAAFSIKTWRKQQDRQRLLDELDGLIKEYSELKSALQAYLIRAKNAQTIAKYQEMLGEVPEGTYSHFLKDQIVKLAEQKDEASEYFYLKLSLYSLKRNLLLGRYDINLRIPSPSLFDEIVTQNIENPDRTDLGQIASMEQSFIDEISALRL